MAQAEILRGWQQSSPSFIYLFFSFSLFAMFFLILFLLSIILFFLLILLTYSHACILLSPKHWFWIPSHESEWLKFRVAMQWYYHFKIVISWQFLLILLHYWIWWSLAWLSETTPIPILLYYDHPCPKRPNWFFDRKQSFASPDLYPIESPTQSQRTFSLVQNLTGQWFHFIFLFSQPLRISEKFFLSFSFLFSFCQTEPRFSFTQIHADRVLLIKILLDYEFLRLYSYRLHWLFYYALTIFTFRLMVA